MAIQRISHFAKYYLGCIIFLLFVTVTLYIIKIFTNFIRWIAIKSKVVIDQIIIFASFSIYFTV
jgi:hypothetical protein